jgi:hypothetical protein
MSRRKSTKAPAKEKSRSRSQSPSSHDESEHESEDGDFETVSILYFLFIVLWTTDLSFLVDVQVEKIQIEYNDDLDNDRSLLTLALKPEVPVYVKGMNEQFEEGNGIVVTFEVLTADSDDDTGTDVYWFRTSSVEYMPSLINSEFFISVFVLF